MDAFRNTWTFYEIDGGFDSCRWTHLHLKMDAFEKLHRAAGAGCEQVRDPEDAARRGLAPPLRTPPLLRPGPLLESKTASVGAYIYIYIYVCVCIYIYVYMYIYR